ncbi:DnaJ domain-containing protein [Mariniblastus sp.]|nr:DnaJ domain-containing protein [Mariniblastus sp.]
MSKPVKNYYEILELSANANQDTIERMFRYLATKHHPDSGGDKEVFSTILKAFEVLRDSDARSAYDATLQQEKQENKVLVDHAREAGPDAAVRHQLLQLFYARRRQAVASPALGSMTIEKEMDLSEEMLNFHLWFFREKGWIKREEDGGLAITAAGVERVEAGKMRAEKLARIDLQCKTISMPAINSGQFSPIALPANAI